MKEQTLAELWKSLDMKARVNLLQTVTDELFIGPDTFYAWRRGSRPIPQAKQQKLAGITERKYNVKLKIA